MSSRQGPSARALIIKPKKEFTWHSWQLQIFCQGPIFHPELFVSVRRCFDWTWAHTPLHTEKPVTAAGGSVNLLWWWGSDDQRGTYRARWRLHLFWRHPRHYWLHTRTDPHRLSSPSRWWGPRLLPVIYLQQTNSQSNWGQLLSLWGSIRWNVM